MESAIRPQTIERLREPLVSTGSPDRRFDRYVISVSSRTLASTRVSGGDRLIPVTFARVIVTRAGRAIRLINHGRNRVAVRSPEAQRDRDRQSPATRQPWRHLADCPAGLQASRRTPPGGP